MWGFIFFAALLPLPFVFHHDNPRVIDPRTRVDSLVALNERYRTWESRLFLKNGDVYQGYTMLVRDSVRLTPQDSRASISFANPTVESVEYRNRKHGNKIGFKSGLKTGAIYGGLLGLAGGTLIVLVPEPRPIAESTTDSQPDMKRSKYYGWDDWPGNNPWGSHRENRHRWTYPIIGVLGGAAIGGSIGGGMGYMIGADAAGKVRFQIKF